MTTRRYYDITVPYTDRLPTWPGDPRPEITRLKSMARGDSGNVTHLSAGVHAGTHMDAPVHFLDGAPGMETLPLDALMGPAQVVTMPEADVITAAVLDAAAIPPDTERILFKTRNSALWDDPAHEFTPDFVAVSADGAGWLVDRGMRLVGVDYLSVEPFGSPGHPTHKTLLGAGMAIVEGLDLRAVEPGIYELACLPMKIVGSDGAPARVVLWRDEG